MGAPPPFTDVPMLGGSPTTQRQQRVVNPYYRVLESKIRSKGFNLQGAVARYNELSKEYGGKHDYPVDSLYFKLVAVKNFLYFMPKVLANIEKGDDPWAGLDSEVNVYQNIVSLQYMAPKHPGVQKVAQAYVTHHMTKSDTTRASVWEQSFPDAAMPDRIALIPRVLDGGTVFESDVGSDASSSDEDDNNADAIAKIQNLVYTAQSA